MGVPEITVNEAQARLVSTAPPLLVDVREQDEWEFCKLPGAVFVPLSLFPALVPERLPDLETPLIVYCHHGMRSAHATEYLLRQGYKDVVNLAGGIDAWSCEIDPAIPRY